MIAGGNRYPWYSGLASFMRVVWPISREADSTFQKPQLLMSVEILEEYLSVAERLANRYDGFASEAAP